MKIDILKKQKEIKEEFNKRVLLNKIKEIILKIENINTEKEELREKEDKREKEILNISLSECKTQEDIKKYEDAIDKNKEKLNNDKVLKEIKEKLKELTGLNYKLFTELKDLLSKVDKGYKDISVFYLSLYFDKLKEILIKYEVINDN